MRVKMLHEISGTRDGVDWPPIGGEVDLPDEEGAELCAMGSAEPVAEKKTAEKRPAASKAETRES